MVSRKEEDERTGMFLSYTPGFACHVKDVCYEKGIGNRMSPDEEEKGRS